MPPKNKLPWWREPMVWLIIGLPITAVIASLVTLGIATRNADTLVKEGYSKEGFTVQEVLEQDREAVRRGLSASMVVDKTHLTVQLAGTPQAEPTLNLTLAHPTEATQDINIALTRSENGSYQGDIPSLPAGKRQVLLETPEQVWRLHGALETPLAGPVKLVAIGASS